MKRPLRHYIRECGTRNKEQGCTAVYSVTNSQGFVPSTDYFSKEVYSKDLSNYKIVKRGMIAYNPSRVNVGSLAVQNAEEQVIVSPLYVVFSVDETQLLPDYICYFLHSDLGMKEIAAHTSGSVRDSLKFSALQNIEITICPVAEQEEIITLLRKIESIIEKRNRTLEKIDELVKSQFIEMFGDIKSNPNNFKVVSLQRLIDEGVITYHLDGNHGGEYPRNDEFIDSGVPYIGANCVVDGEVCLSNAKYLSLERAGRLKKGIAQTHDVLFAHNATVGPVAILVTDKPKVILSTSLTAFRRNRDKMNEMFLASFLRSDSFVSQYIPIMKQTTRNQFPVTAQRKCLFMVPPIDLQNEFARFVEQTDKSKVLFTQKLFFQLYMAICVKAFEKNAQMLYNCRREVAR